MIFPAVWGQVAELFNELPKMLDKAQRLMIVLPERYPQLFSEEQIRTLAATAGEEMGRFGQRALSFSLSKLPCPCWFSFF